MRDGLLVAVVLTAFAVLHSLPATKRAKGAAARHFGAGPVRRYYRIGYNLVSLALTAVAAWLFLGTPDVTVFSPPPVVTVMLRALQTVSAVFAVLGFGVFRAGEFLGLEQALGREDPSPERRDLEGVSVLPLQKKGVYGIVRHPMYSGCIGVLLFSPAFTRNWIILRLLAIAYFVFGAIAEDRRLVESYGDEYRRYMREVPRLVPRPGRLF